ncbi:hypothetical protein HK105_206991 [Polyrhizophydium stewartii]|uniref:Peptidase A1 domain-containing protein n=1 Tax=Polyrhizophydium stewartii TaxID=2732419 RepID=A0ABR4N246_9FUNG
MTQLNVLGVTLDVQLDTSSSDLEVPNAGINDYSSAHVSGFVGVVGTNIISANAPIIVVTTQYFPMLFEDTNGHGRLGLGPVSNAYLHKNPPTVLEAWVASGAISNTNVSLRLCPTSPQIAWMESPGPGAYLVEVYDVRIGGQPAPIDNAFQFNSTYSVIQSCNDKVLLTPDIADMFKNKIVASAGYPSDQLYIVCLPNITFEFYASRSTIGTISITLGPRQYLRFDSGDVWMTYINGGDNSKIIFGHSFFTDHFSTRNNIRDKRSCDPEHHGWRDHNE